jgi:cystathionine beta-lyase/cystathionine gamma-synthase
MAKHDPSGPPALGATSPLVPPLYLASVYTLPDLDALDAVIEAQQPGFMYARDGHPNARHLADQLAAAEGASWAVVCGSGMAALTAALLTHTQQGDYVVAANSLYGRTSQLLKEELSRYGVTTTLVEARDLRQVRAALEQPAKLLLVETISNPLLRLADVPAVADLAHAHGCPLLVDNTFATPALVRPLDLGADLVVESLTKMIGGHSDVTLGLLCGTGDQLAEVTRVVSIWGLASNPFDCWLASRGLATLALRMRAASANAMTLADWLAEQPGVARVLYPGRPDHPDYELACRLLPSAFGNMVTFELSGGREAANHFLRKARGIPFSPSLGNTTTTCSHPGTTSHRYVSPAEKRRQGITEGIIRLSVGVEEVELIRAELARGLA